MVSFFLLSIVFAVIYSEFNSFTSKESAVFVMYFSAINESRFKKTVIPGDQVIFEVKLLKFRMGTCKISGTASVDGDIVAFAEMMASVVDKRE